MSYVLVRTWQKLQENWILVLPIIALSLFVHLFQWGGQTLGSGQINAFSLLSLFLLDRAITAGWLNQMKAVLLQPEKKVDLNPFLEGIPRYFWIIVTGSSAFILLAFVLLSLVFMLATTWVGSPDMQQVQKIVELIQKGDNAVFEAYMMQNQESIQYLFKWAGIALIGVCAICVIGAFFYLWPQYCVFKDVNWIQGWQYSYRFVTRNIILFTLFSLVWLFPTAILFVSSFSTSPIIQGVSFIGNFVAKTYFTLMFCQLMVLVDQSNFPCTIPKRQ